MIVGLRVLAFDFDGVISDSMPPQDECWQKAVEDVLGPGAEAERAQIRKNLFEGKAGEQMFANVAVSAEVSRRLRIAKDKLWDAIALQTPLMTGCVGSLTRLATRYNLAIATTAKRPYVEHLLDREKVQNLFKVVVTNADVKNPKPAPDMLLHIAAQLKSPISEICMTGDSASDFEMAKRAEVVFVWFKSNHEAPALPVGTDRIVRSWQEFETQLT